MKVCIIEDEKLAAERLQKMIQKYDPSIEVIFQGDSVKKSIEWFQNNKHPDLAFFDIQLADGISFEIFEQVSLHCPVIFTTAYDEYAIRAFKVNSIDYLLKPVDFEELFDAIDKFKQLHTDRGSTLFDSKGSLDKFMHLLTNKYKSRFVIKVGERLKTIEIEKVLFFYSLDKATFITTSDNHNYNLDYSLETLEEIIDPSRFFRINRKYLISLDSILDIVSYTNSRLKVKLKYADEKDIVVSRERVQGFKKWLDG